MPNSHGLLRRIIRKGIGGESLVTAGQPTHATHPEVCRRVSRIQLILLSSCTKHNLELLQLLRRSELTPGIDACEYAARRDTLLSLMPSTCLAILSAAAESFMTGHIPYPYRQVRHQSRQYGITSVLHYI